MSCKLQSRTQVRRKIVKAKIGLGEDLHEGDRDRSHPIAAAYLIT